MNVIAQAVGGHHKKHPELFTVSLVDLPITDLYALCL
jgi:hypothetical protein